MCYLEQNEFVLHCSLYSRIDSFAVCTRAFLSIFYSFGFSVALALLLDGFLRVGDRCLLYFVRLTESLLEHTRSVPRLPRQSGQVESAPLEW